MMNFNRPVRTKTSVLPKKLLLIAVVLVVLLFMGTGFVRRSYTDKLRPVSSSQATQIFTVEKGASVKEIAAELEDKGLIKDARALEYYVYSKKLGSKFQAGTYALSPSQGTKTIVSIMTKGQVATRLVTILPGRRIDQVRADLINAGFTPEDVDKALDPAQYADLPVLSYKPAEVKTLEGLLWPDSYQKDATTPASQIIRASLVEMDKRLTPDLRQAFAGHGLTTYQGLILASIITQEVNKPSDQAQAAQVFLSRIKLGMMLGSDVTAFYGSVMAGHSADDVTYDSPYNTRLHVGFPPTPISTITGNALNAMANPANTDWLFFVAGDDGTTYFSKTVEEHEALTKKHCTKLCN
jgi:UPF0755 protein